MEKYTTEQGGLYYGANAEAVVAQMRRAEFRPEPRGTNAEYMAAASRRIENLTEAPLEYTNEETFLKALVARGFLRPVTEDITCPLAHTLCTARRDTCDDGCWLKKAPNGGELE
jgi:hypothetical protein